MAEKTVSFEQVGQSLGLKPGEATAIIEQIRENNARLKACERHQFTKSKDPVARANRGVCVNCHGEMRLGEIMAYEEGVKHAGSPFEVWL